MNKQIITALLIGLEYTRVEGSADSVMQILLAIKMCDTSLPWIDNAIRDQEERMKFEN